MPLEVCKNHSALNGRGLRPGCDLVDCQLGTLHEVAGGVVDVGFGNTVVDFEFQWLFASRDQAARDNCLQSMANLGCLRLGTAWQHDDELSLAGLGQEVHFTKRVVDRPGYRVEGVVCNGRSKLFPNGLVAFDFQVHNRQGHTEQLTFGNAAPEFILEKVSAG